MNLLEALEGSGWSIQQAVQTTYSFDPRFYSSYVRPRLNKRNCELPLVFIDKDKYEMGITEPEWRAAPIGTDYLLEPANTGGVFHPKVNLFASERSVFFSVSSANLTLEEYCKAAQMGQMAGFQKGWLTSDENERDADIQEAYFIAREIRDFFEDLVGDNGLITGQDAVNYTQEMVETLGWLDEIEDEIGESSENRSSFFLNSLSEPILSQVLEYVGDVEVASLYAPFYGTPSVINDIADLLEPDQVEIIVEPESTALETDNLEEELNHDHTVRVMNHNSTRWVHAKFLFLDGDWGSACLYGSPNMTSSALLQSLPSGNLETALLTVNSSSEKTLHDAVFDSQEFDFSVSEPVTDIDSLELRSASYEDWESIDDGRDTEITLEDARLTQPGSDGSSELILNLSDVRVDFEEHDFVVRTDKGEEKEITEFTEDGGDTEVSVLISEDESPVWREAVVRVKVDGLGETNPRKVMMETQAYYREYREIVESEGTRSSNTLLREVLENPDTAVMSVFDVALSEIRESRKIGSVEEEEKPDPKVEEDEEPESFPERGPKKISAQGSPPSLSTLIKRHLTHHRERALDSLELEDTPVPEDIDRCLEHAETFWETIELLYFLERRGEMDESGVDADSLFDVCEGEVAEWFSDSKRFVRRLNGIIDQIENKDAIREVFVEDEQAVSDLPVWKSFLDILVLHPGIVLELDYQSEYEVYSAKNTLENRLVSSLDTVYPHVEQHLYDGTNLVRSVDSLISNLSVEFGDEGRAVDISGQGIQVLVLYVFVQEVAHDSSFLQGLRNHPRYSREDLRKLASFSLQGEEAAVKYGIVNKLQFSVVLKSEIEKIESLAE